MQPVRKVPPPRLQLTGIVTIGGKTFAMVTGGRAPGKGKQPASQRLVAGSPAAEGWQVKKILPDRVILGSGQEEHELLLRQYKPVTPAQAAAQARVAKDGKDASKAKSPTPPRTKAAAKRPARTARPNQKQEPDK